MRSTLKEFFDNEQAGGIVLMACTVASLLLANTFSPYSDFWEATLGGSSLVHWINDGLMAIFFLLVGLELKREFVAGELSNWRKAITPIVAAVGGVSVPALLYVLINLNSGNLRGVGIPMATDVVFALGVLSLLGERVPVSIKVFLTALAVIDDICAILVISVVYSQAVALDHLVIALAILSLLLILSRFRVWTLTPYIIGGFVMWYFMLQSGIHASITGVLLALAIPFDRSADTSPAQILQSKLNKPVSFIILPLFALANTSVTIPLDFNSFFSPVNTGIIIGLLAGKPLGIVLLTYLVVAFRLGSLPLALKWKHVIGIGFLGGIGFTISVFMTVLAFEQPETIDQAKLAVIAASTVSGMAGFVYFKRVLGPPLKRKFY